MNDSARTFLTDLLSTASPSGFETPAQRVWVEYVSEFADSVETDAYGNAVAVVEGGDTEFALAGHADEIGFIVRDVTDDGFLRIAPIGGSDRTVSKGQHVTVHAEGGAVAGVVGQTAIHLREREDDEIEDIESQFVDVGADSAEEAGELVSVGDPVTFETPIRELVGSKVAGRGMDNRVGIWAAAEGLRRAAEAGADATVYAFSTVQEEVGLKGAQMVGFEVDPDAVVATDVTHATDNPDVSTDKQSPVELGAGPVVARGSANHPSLVDLARETADAEDLSSQLQAAGIRTGTDADAFFTTRGGIPSLNVGIPNRYMHTPVEVVDSEDLDAVADLLAGMAVRAGDAGDFVVDV